MSENKNHFVKAFRVDDLKARKEDGALIFSGYANVFDIVDYDGDVVVKGAFADTIEEQKDDLKQIKILWQHDPSQPIGYPLELKEDDHGLYIRGVLSATSLGRDAYQLITDGVIGVMSIGYDVVKSSVSKDLKTPSGDPVRLLEALWLWEVSLVTFAANSSAKITGTKASMWTLDAGKWKESGSMADKKQEKKDAKEKANTEKKRVLRPVEVKFLVREGETVAQVCAAIETEWRKTVYDKMSIAEAQEVFGVPYNAEDKPWVYVEAITDDVVIVNGCNGVLMSYGYLRDDNGVVSISESGVITNRVVTFVPVVEGNDDAEIYDEDEEMESKEAWTTAYVNELPDAAFAVISEGGEKDDDGLTVPRSLRHLPHHTKSVKDPDDNKTVDLPHLRNALARVTLTSLTDDEMTAANDHLVMHAKALGVGNYAEENNEEEKSRSIKAGKVLSAVNRGKLEMASSLIAEVLKSSDIELAEGEGEDDGMKSILAKLDNLKQMVVTK